jgi:hypothetical protein
MDQTVQGAAEAGGWHPALKSPPRGSILMVPAVCLSVTFGAWIGWAAKCGLAQERVRNPSEFDPT